MRNCNHEVLSFCADDAHGAPIMMKADEMQIKPQILNKAINVAFKSNMADVQEQMDELESILVSTGHLKEV